MHKIYWVHLYKVPIDNILGTVYNSLTRSSKTTPNTQATELIILINLYHVPVSERLSNTNRHASDTEVATNLIRKRRSRVCVYQKQS